MGRMKYVQRRANRFEFRFPLPDDLAGQPVPDPCPEPLAPFVNSRTGRLKTELIRSLQTNDAKAAERQALVHIAEAHALVDLARRVLRDGPPTALPPEQIAALSREYEIDLLQRDEILRAQGSGANFSRDLSREDEPAHDGQGMTDDDLQLYRFLITTLDRDARAQAAKMRPSDTIGLLVNREAAYWFPLIALFSGARRTEIAQLKVGDVRRSEGGIWFFDISGEGEDQNLKTASSARSVPLHEEPLRLGLLDYVATRARTHTPDAPLWPGFEPPVDPAAKAWTKWFGRYFGTHVIDHPAKTFHSFRHTFKRACREAGLSKEIHNALTGHSGGGVGRRYGRERRADGSLDRGISLQRLQAEINKIDYPGVSFGS